MPRSNAALTEAFDVWIRGPFVEMNCALEDMYWDQEDRNNVEGVGDEIKARLEEEGRGLIADILEHWDPNVTTEEAYYLLGNVGYYMGACRRHEITLELREKESPLVEASALATKLALLLGVAPRLVTSQMQYLNLAKGGDDRSFTRRKDEVLFIQCNSMAQLNYLQAADALGRIEPLGLSHPLSRELLSHAHAAMVRTRLSNAQLFKELNPKKFFHCVRPYVKSYMVGRQIWRGANAGDLSAIGEVDLRLGLCSSSDPFYLAVLAEKAPYCIADDQQRLARAIRCTPLLDQFVAAAEAKEAWVPAAAKALLPICEEISTIAKQHHDMLVRRFIEAPTKKMLEKHMSKLTASGQELNALLADLERLRDLRMANEVEGVGSRHADIARLRECAEKAV